MKYLCGILEPGTEGGFPSGDNGGGLPPGSFLESLSFFLELRLPPARCELYPTVCSLDFVLIGEPLEMIP